VLRVVGAAENNLRQVDADFPGGVTAVVGVSGSGKSSLVFDTLYYESRRRFLETLSLGSQPLQSRPARVRAIEGLSPAVAVAQNVVNSNPRSTVATAAGVHPYLRVLFARFADRHCRRCGEVARVAFPGRPARGAGRPRNGRRGAGGGSCPAGPRCGG
jgi:excinuclease ABC subunit A